jgi:uncharacterized repeat protein (TIGR03837 family)
MNAQTPPDSPPTLMTKPMPNQLLRWDIFCRVIDNFGDIGVCWRLSADLASRGHPVRLWVDDPTALHWMAPGALEGKFPCIQVMAWEQSTRADVVAALPLADVWLETFGCEIATEFIAASAKPPVWINLEHLTAEGFAQRNHTLPSPVMHGPAAGWTKYFFYPGFTEGTGGLLREPDLATRQAQFDRVQWLKRHGIEWSAERLVSLFCYEPAALADFLQQLLASPTPTLLLVTPGRAASAVRVLQNESPATGGPHSSALRIVYLPPLTQLDYDHLLWACDFNCVRGEDSLVRALWAKKPFVWQIYPQDDDAHHAKLNAFLDVIKAGLSLRQSHLTWNAPPTTIADATNSPSLPRLDLTTWQATLSATQQRLQQMDDLCTQLIRFVQKTR